jgi:hypothetical protein
MQLAAYLDEPIMIHRSSKENLAPFETCVASRKGDVAHQLPEGQTVGLFRSVELELLVLVKEPMLAQSRGLFPAQARTSGGRSLNYVEHAGEWRPFLRRRPR